MTQSTIPQAADEREIIIPVAKLSVASNARPSEANGCLLPSRTSVTPAARHPARLAAERLL